MSRQGRRSTTRPSRFGPANAEPLYLPPFRVAALETRAASREDRQRLAWERLRKRIHGIVNRANASNAGECVVDLFRVNVIRGLGLLCRSLLRVQVVSQNFTPVYAAIVAALNARIPETGEVLLARLIAQLKRGMDQSDRGVCLASVKFIAHLFNQSVVDALLPLEIMNMLASAPSNDSVELLVGFMKECGALLEETEPRMLDDLFQLLRRIVQEGEVDIRIQYLVEGLMAIRRTGFKDFSSIPEGLDLVPDEDRIIHSPSFSGDVDVQTDLDTFSFQEDWEEAEVRYALFRFRILGEDDDLLFETVNEESEEAFRKPSENAEQDADKSEVPERITAPSASKEALESGPGDKARPPTDMSEEDLVSFRRKVYLQIMSAVSYEECAHKLAVFIRERPGHEAELCNMVLECCSQERTFMRFYGLVGKQFCLLNKIYVSKFEEAFAEHYATIHRFDSRKIRNIANFYAFLLCADALPWSVLGIVVLSKEETTASSRIFLKYLMLEIAQTLSVAETKKRFEDPGLSPYVKGLFPSENPTNIRFAIDYFTAIGLGPLTDEMRRQLRSLPAKVVAGPQDGEEGNKVADDNSLSSSSSSLSPSSESSSSLSSSSYENDDFKKREGSEDARREDARRGAEVDARKRAQSPSRSMSPRRRRKYPRRSFEHEDPGGYHGLTDPRERAESPLGRGQPPSFPRRGRFSDAPDRYETPRYRRDEEQAFRGRGRGRGHSLTIPAWVTRMQMGALDVGHVSGARGGDTLNTGNGRETSRFVGLERERMDPNPDRFRDPSRSPSPRRGRRLRDSRDMEQSGRERDAVDVFHDRDAGDHEFPRQRDGRWDSRDREYARVGERCLRDDSPQRYAGSFRERPRRSEGARDPGPYNRISDSDGARSPTYGRHKVRRRDDASPRSSDSNPARTRGLSTSRQSDATDYRRNRY